MYNIDEHRCSVSFLRNIECGSRRTSCWLLDMMGAGAVARRRRSSRRSVVKTPKRFILQGGKKSRRRGRPSKRKGRYGSVFFAVLVVTVASTIGFFGLVASVIAGG